VLSNEGKKIREFWKPENEVNRTNERHVRKALKAVDIEEHSISYFLYLPAYKVHHKKVAKALKLIGGK
jgi:hypothetical protein